MLPVRRWCRLSGSVLGSTDLHTGLFAISYSARWHHLVVKLGNYSSVMKPWLALNFKQFSCLHTQESAGITGICYQIVCCLFVFRWGLFVALSGTHNANQAVQELTETSLPLSSAKCWGQRCVPPYPASADTFKQLFLEKKIIEESN